LLRAGADPASITKTKKETALMIAAKLGHTAVCHVLLDEIASPPPPTAGNAQPSALALLKCNPCARSATGTTALILAAGEGHTDIVNALLRVGVPHDVADEAGNTALHVSAAGGHALTCEVLMTQEREAWKRHVDLRLTHGSVTRMQHFHKLLLQRNCAGQRPPDIALRNGHHSLAHELLKQTKELYGGSSDVVGLGMGNDEEEAEALPEDDEADAMEFQFALTERLGGNYVRQHHPLDTVTEVASKEAGPNSDGVSEVKGGAGGCAGRVEDEQTQET